MATLNLLFGNQRFNTTIGALKLDAAINITHDATAVVSKNPIESGSDVTDNVRIENRTLTIEGIITESPILLLGSALNIFTGAVSSIGETVFGDFSRQALAAGIGSLSGAIASRNENDLLYPEKAFQYLLELRNNAIPFNVQTKLEVYENMIITRLNVPQNSAVGKQIRFSANLEQIEIVQTQNVILPERNTKNVPGATQNQNLGKQPRNEATESNATLARQALNRITGL